MCWKCDRRKTLMFHKLHYQLALFYTFVTGCIFTVLTLLCLIFAENSLKAEDNAAFLRQLNSDPSAGTGHDLPSMAEPDSGKRAVSAVSL